MKFKKDGGVWKASPAIECKSGDGAKLEVRLSPDKNCFVSMTSAEEYVYLSVHLTKKKLRKLAEAILKECNE